MNTNRKIIIYLFVLILLSSFNPKISNIFLIKFQEIFFIKKINLVNKDTEIKNEIKSRLNEFYNTSLFNVNKSDILKNLKSVNIIENIKIRKVYPDQIFIDYDVIEPLAIFYIKNKKYFITASNNFVKFDNNFNKNLPYIIGRKGEMFFFDFINLLKKKNFPIELIKEFHFFKINRWDLHLFDEKIIKLPSESTSKAIERSIILLEKNIFEEYNILDLRLNDKVITTNE